MPIIERKTLDRVNSEDVLYLDAGTLIKAGQKVGDNISALAKYNVSFVTVVHLTKEERLKVLEDQSESLIQDYIEKKHREHRGSLRARLRETLLDLHIPYSESDQSFNIPGKRAFLSEDDLLARKIESMNTLHVAAGSSRIINKYKLKFAVDVIAQIQSEYESLSPIQHGRREARGSVNRLHVNSVRLSSWYDDSRYRAMGDALVNQSIDAAFLYLHTFINLNKKRIAEGRPLSESRYDPSLGKSESGIYQYRPGLILDATIGVLLHNLGLAHQSVHQIISGKPLLSSEKTADQKKIKTVQGSIYALKHLLDRDDISSISKMMGVMQKDYADGTGFPSPNENRFLYEFVRLFHIIDFYDQMTNPILSKTPFSRMEVIEYLIENSGEYRHSGERFTPQKRFDADLVKEFLDVLAPYEIGEKVYLYQRGKHNQPLFVGKVASYLDSHIPLVTILKDETKGQQYRDGTLFLHISSSSLYVRSNGKMERKQYGWVNQLEIFDKNVDAGNLSDYEDEIFGKMRQVHKKYRG